MSDAPDENYAPTEFSWRRVRLWLKVIFAPYLPGLIAFSDSEIREMQAMAAPRDNDDTPGDA